MGKISDYTRVLASKLADVFACDQTDNGTTETKSATVEQIGTAIGTLQNFADLDTSNKTLVDSINEIAAYTPVYNNTANGAIATFDTSLALPLQDCTIGINGTNLTGANIIDIGANWLHQTTWTETENGISVPTATSANANLYNGKLPKGTFYIKDFTGGSNSTHQIVLIKDGSVVEYITTQTYTLTVDDTNYNSTWIIRLYLYTGNSDTIIKPIMSTSSLTTYKPYVAPTTTAISWQSEAGTVSEGSLNVTTGKLTVVNGSMGAGVYQITPIPINQISGTNNIFCDTGNTSVKYVCSLKDYIDSQ